MLAVLKKINQTVVEMILGMLLYGAVGQLIVCIVGDELVSRSLGWWIGIVVAMISSYHMWWSLNRALGLGAGDATKLITTQNMVRYLLTVVVMMLVMITEVANPLLAVFGLFGLKVGAYLQPLMHRFIGTR